MPASGQDTGLSGRPRGLCLLSPYPSWVTVFPRGEGERLLRALGRTRDAGIAGGLFAGSWSGAGGLDYFCLLA